jgi:autotransporter-associated beta strand protein
VIVKSGHELGYRGPHRRLLLSGTALPVILLFVAWTLTAPAFADGGNGGDQSGGTGGLGALDGTAAPGGVGQTGTADGGGGGAAPGPAGGNGTSGGNGGDSAAGPGGVGGAGGISPGGAGQPGLIGSMGLTGGGGGGGGANGSDTGSLPSATTTGGAGGSGAIGIGGGGGGAGGWGAVVTTMSNANTVTIRGGVGGAGGDSSFGLNGQGGNGGSGGIGASFGIGTLNNSETIAGGVGGAGGADLNSAGDGGAGGHGGIGLVGSGLAIINSGTIAGGNGGNGGAGGDTRPPGGGNGGNGGTAISGTNLTVINSGSILAGAGGAAGPGPGGNPGGAGTNGNAITFTGGVNSLEIQAGSSINGNVVGVSGGTDKLIFGGATDSSFGTGAIGTQYQNFTNFEKTGTSVWTLTGSPTPLVSNWTISAGVLSVANINSFDNSGGTALHLTFNGGTLRATNALVFPNATALTSAGGTIDTQNNVVSLNALSGAGGLAKIGTGRLQVITATYLGATSVNEGIFQAGSANGLSAFSAHTVAIGATIDLGGGNQIIGSLAGAGHVTTGGGRLTTGGDNTSTVFSGVISDGGGLTKTGTGTFTLSGVNTYTGATTVNGGTLEIGSGGSIANSSSLTNSANFVVDGGGSATFGSVTNTATGNITVAAGGTVHDDLNNAGAVTNNGAYFANVATNTGTITNNGTWTGNINNTDGGLLGSGSVVGNVTMGNGAVFAPGNGMPGSSMTISGSLAFSSGAFFQVAINPTTASFANATGSANLGGASVQAFFSSGTYVAKQYTIVSAAGGLGNSTFGSQANTNLPSGFTTALSYDPTHAFLDLSLVFVPPPGSGLNINQQNVANAIVNAFNTSGAVPIAFGALTPAGLTQVSGELGTGSQQSTFDAMNQFMSLMTDPFIAGRGDGPGISGSTTGYADEANAYAGKRKANDALAAIYTKAPAPVQSFEARWSTWIAGYGGSQTTEGNAALGSNNTTSSVYATAVGADYRFSPNTIAGFALAGGGTNFNVVGSGYGRSDLFQAGAFIRHTVGQAYISGALAYGWQDVTTERIVTAAGADHLRAEFNANAFSGRVESGYRFVSPWTGGIGITPYAAGQSTTIDLPAYAESTLSGANTFALAYGAKDVTDPRGELGLRTDKSYAMQTAILVLRSRFAWAHDFNPDRSIAATFQTLPGSSFVVNGAAQASESALTTASAELKWINNWSVAATFEGEFSSVTSSYAGKGVVRYQW